MSATVTRSCCRSTDGEDGVALGDEWTGRRREVEEYSPSGDAACCLRFLNFFDERFAARLKLFQIRRTKWFVSALRKHQVVYLEIAHVLIRRYGVESVLISLECNYASPTLLL